MELSVGTLVTIGSAIVLMAVGYGVIKAKVKASTEKQAEQEKRLNHFQNEWTGFQGAGPNGKARFVKPEECSERMDRMEGSVTKIEKTTERQEKAVDGLSNFARYMLTTKERLALSEVNKIMNGDE